MYLVLLIFLYLQHLNYTHSKPSNEVIFQQNHCMTNSAHSFGFMYVMIMTSNMIKQNEVYT